MESKMQDYIEAGINERERCYNEIVELEHLRDALAAKVAEVTAERDALAAQVEVLKVDNKNATDKCNEVAAVWRIAKIAAFNIVDAVIRGALNQSVVDNAVILKSIIYHEDQNLMEARNKFDTLNAELSALCEFRDEVVGVMNNSEGVWGWHKNHTIATWDELLPVVPDLESPQHHLAEIRAEAGEIGYYNGFKDALVIEPPLPPATGTYATVDIFAYRVEQSSRYAANQYADSIRKGEVK